MFFYHRHHRLQILKFLKLSRHKLVSTQEMQDYFDLFQ
ncbi:hypothetical protein GFB63_09540 [Streptococcus thermophilus]|nr:hypothetical protein GFB63_09540 [Streptococcus thermophilus]